MRRESSLAHLSACTLSPRATRGHSHGCLRSFRGAWQRYMTVFESASSRTNVAGSERMSTYVNQHVRQTHRGRCGVHQVRRDLGFRQVARLAIHQQGHRGIRHLLVRWGRRYLDLLVILMVELAAPMAKTRTPRARGDRPRDRQALRRLHQACHHQAIPHGFKARLGQCRVGQEALLLLVLRGCLRLVRTRALRLQVRHRGLSSAMMSKADGQSATGTVTEIRTVTEGAGVAAAPAAVEAEAGAGAGAEAGAGGAGGIDELMPCACHWPWRRDGSSAR